MSEALTRLSRVLGMMGSQHDGEVLNAARMAEKIRREMDRSWTSLLTGASDQRGSASDHLRAARAEARAMVAERRANELETRVTRLEAELAELRRGASSSRQSSARYGSFHGLSGEAERVLVEGLTERMRDADWIYLTTGWHRPMSLPARLKSIARKHGLQFQQPWRGRYRFIRP